MVSVPTLRPLYSGLDSPDTTPATFPSRSQHLRLYLSPSKTVARPGILGLLLAPWVQEFLLNLSLEPGGRTLNSTRSSHCPGRPGQRRRVPTWSCLGPLAASFSFPCSWVCLPKACDTPLGTDHLWPPTVAL